mgnify:CR=1 FL=1
MAFDSLRTLLPTPAVHAKPDAGGVNPEGQNRHGQQRQSKREHQEEQSAHPVPNALGEITGKVIDTTA